MFPSAFGSDPFFMDPFEHMNRMMSGFSSPMFSSPFMMHRPGAGMLQLEGGGGLSLMQQQQQQRRPVDNFHMSPFGMLESMSSMQNMMRNMQRDMMSAGSFPSMGSHSFQSSTVIMHNDGNGPRVIQSSSSSRLGPQGVRETRKSMKDSGTGEMRMSIGHHINERGHIIEKAKNGRTGDAEEKQEYINIEEEEAEDFNKEWMHKMSSGAPRHHHRSVGYHHHHSGGSRHEPYSRHGHQRHQRPHTAAITYHPHQDDTKDQEVRDSRPSSSGERRH